MFILVLKLELLSVVINLVSRPWGTQIAALSGYILVLFSAALPFAAIIDRVVERTGFNIKVVAVNIILSLILAFSLLSSDTLNVDMDLFISIVSFLSTYAAITIPSQQLETKDARDIFLIAKALSILFIIYTIFPFSFRYNYVREWGIEAFTMRMGNPNGTAIQVFNCICILLIENRSTNQKSTKIINWIIIALLIYPLILFQCRTVFLCALAMIAFGLMPKIHLFKWFPFVVIILSAFLIYLQMSYTQEGMTLLGKDLVTGRSHAFRRYLNLIYEDPLKYIFGQLGRHRLNNYHNGIISLLMNLGFVGMVLCMGIWYYELRNCIKKSTLAMQSIAIISLLIYLLHAATEGAPMMGAILYGTPIVTLFRLAKDDFHINEFQQESKPSQRSYKYIR